MAYDIGKCRTEDKEYPEAFHGLSGMPGMFYYRGDVSLLNDSVGVAIVGSRKCSDNVLNLARGAGRAAAAEGICTINGLALGIDTEALKGALEKGGRCVAVLAGGINRVYPKSNEGLMQEIISSGGCIISEYEPNAEPKKYTFVERDRLQSALGQGVLVIAAETESGTMHTVRAAMKQSRRLAAYSSKIVNMTGNKFMVDKGAAEISTIDDLKVFYNELKHTEDYQQMTLFDVV